jgi:hypothetical protein
MSNPRRKIIYDSTVTNSWEIDAHNSGPVVLYDASGNPMFKAANPGVITATDLDIRDLTSASDSVAVTTVKPDGTNTMPSMDTVGRAGFQKVTDGIDTMAINADGSINVVATATNLDIRDLTSASDSIAVTTVKPDGTNTMPSLDVNSRRGYVQLTNGANEPNVTQIASASDDIDDNYGLNVAAALYGRIDTDTVRPIAIDSSSHAIEIIAHEHHEIHGGSHYFVRGYQDLAINNVLDFTWLMQNTTKWIHWTWEIVVENETNWLVYEGVTATNPLAVAVTPFNNDRNSGNTSGTTMKYELQASLAAANADTNVAAATLLASGIAGAGKNAGSVGRANEKILKQNTLYCLRAIATAAGFINFTMEWYEHTNKG